MPCFFQGLSNAKFLLTMLSFSIGFDSSGFTSLAIIEIGSDGVGMAQFDGN